MESQEVAITLADEYLPKFETVVFACEELGLHVNQRLPGIGVVIGTIRTEQIVALQQVEGVAAIEATQGYQLPPPTSEIQ